MKIRNISQLKENINVSIMLVILILLAATISVLMLIHLQYNQKKLLLNQEELQSAANIVKSDLSEKLGIIASSSVFQDYLHSGSVTRENLYPHLLLQISTLKSKVINGMQILDKDGQVIFADGNAHSKQVTLKLCYLNQNLDADMGECQYSLRVYLDMPQLLNELQKLNKSIQSCSSCVPWSFIHDAKFGGFAVESMSDIQLFIGIAEGNDYFFYSYLMLIALSLLVFGAWTWFRLSSLLTNYIAKPINLLASSFRENEILLNHPETIDEIQFLIDEINHWKVRLKKIQHDENAENIAKIVAQFAHDVRSPLAVINIIVRELANIEAKHQSVLISATERISGIANQFLNQYKNPKLISIPQSLTPEVLPELLHSIVLEKQQQYHNMADLDLQVDEDVWSSFVMVSASDFKRIISNLVNNAVEAAINRAHITISARIENENVLIDIADNGAGIDASLIPTILKGGVSIGKEDGNGMGLSHAYATIKSWNGDLTIQSELQVGTTITLKLNKMQRVAA